MLWRWSVVYVQCKMACGSSLFCTLKIGTYSISAASISASISAYSISVDMHGFPSLL